jgi:hypothetical protein
MELKLDPKRFKQMFYDWHASNNLNSCPWLFYIDKPNIDSNLNEFQKRMQSIIDLEKGRFCDTCISLLKSKHYNTLRQFVKKENNSDVLGPCPCDVIGCQSAINRLIKLGYFTKEEKEKQNDN